MPGGVIVPQARPKESGLDTILKGLQIAQAVYGIKTGVDESGRADERLELDKQKQAAEQERLRLEAASKNTISPKEYAEIGKTNDFVPKGTPGAESIMLKTAQGDLKEVSFLPKKDKPEMSLIDTVNAAGQPVKRWVAKGAEGDFPQYVKPSEQAPADPINTLPDDKKKQVAKLSDMVGTNVGVANSLAAELDSFRNAKTEDDKIRVGQGMLKLLNSAIGPDAVGAEEAKRVGAALEYQVFNVRQPGPVFGRDLPGFEAQIENKIRSLMLSSEKNQSEIDKIAGRAAKPVDSMAAKEPERKSGFSEALGDASHPDVIQNGHTYKWNPKSGKYE